jgi:hypothetical protein
MTDPAQGGAARERYEQAMVDADIDGLAKSVEAEKLIAEMIALETPIENQIERLVALFEHSGRDQTV